MARREPNRLDLNGSVFIEQPPPSRSWVEVVASGLLALMRWLVVPVVLLLAGRLPRAVMGALVEARTPNLAGELRGAALARFARLVSGLLAVLLVVGLALYPSSLWGRVAFWAVVALVAYWLARPTAWRRRGARFRAARHMLTLAAVLDAEDPPSFGLLEAAETPAGYRYRLRLPAHLAASDLVRPAVAEHWASALGVRGATISEGDRPAEVVAELRLRDPLARPVDGLGTWGDLLGSDDLDTAAGGL